MSAECHDCGSDIVYPEGTWPIGVCPVCESNAEVERLRGWLREYDDETDFCPVCRHGTHQRDCPVRAALEQSQAERTTE